ncbi:MAG TPA: metallophosphoesterase [Caldisericia bacterium]|nr:metallophosphoesterase [Caldisericia bacterium]
MLNLLFKKREKKKVLTELSLSEKEKIIELYRQGKTLKEIQEITGRGKTSIIRVLKKAKQRGVIEGRKGIQQFKKVVEDINQIKQVKIFNDYLKVNSEKVLVFSDVHLPFTDFNFTEKMFDIALNKFKCSDCIIAGDLFDEGIFSDYLHYEKILWQEEKEITKKFLSFIVENFEKVYILCGNHDNRILRKLEFNETYSEIFKTIYYASNLYITDYPFIIVNKDWYVVHPGSYSQISGQVAKKLATKYSKNIISTHGHFTSLGFDISGKFYAIDIGGLVDMNKVEYLHHNITTHPRWIKGFVILINNHPFLFTEKDNFEVLNNIFLKRR